MEPQNGDHDKRAEEIARLCDALVRDFDGAGAVVTNELATNDDDPSGLLGVLVELLRHGDDLVPAETLERLECELLPQLVQLLLSRTIEHPEALGVAVAFLQLVMDHAASRLLQGDPSLLPSLVRILDAHRPFYLCHPGQSPADAADDDDDDKNPQRDVTEPHPIVATMTQPPRDNEDDDADDGNSDVTRTSWLFLRLLRYWCDLRGLDVLTQCLVMTTVADDHNNEEEEAAFEFEAIQCVFRVLYAIKDFLNESFVGAFVLRLAKATAFCVRMLPGREIVAVSRETLMEIVQVLELMAFRVPDRATDDDDDLNATTPTFSTVERQVQVVQLELLLRYVQSSSLERRIYGLTEIVGVFRKQQSSLSSLGTDSTPGAELMMSPLTRDLLVSWISHSGLLELIFGEKKHTELIKRSTPLFQLSSDWDLLPDAWIRALWRCGFGWSRECTDATLPADTGDDVVRDAVTTVLLEVIENLQVDGVRVLFDLVRGTPGVTAPATDHSALIVLNALAQRSAEIRQHVLMHVWLIAPSVPTSDGQEYCIRMIDRILRGIAEAARGERNDSGPALEILDEFVRLCTDNLQREDNVVVSLRVLERLGEIIHDMTHAVSGECGASVVRVVLDSISKYKVRCSIEPTQSPTQHLLAIRDRLLALRAAWLIGAYAGLEQPLSYCQLEQVWDGCIANSCAEDEATLAFQWFELCVRTRLHVNARPRLCDLPSAEHLLTSKFDTIGASRLTLSALCCFHHLFREVNVAKGGLVCVSQIENIEQSCTDIGTALAQEASVVDQLTGLAIVGREQLWRLALKATDSSVAEEAITLLARYHLDVIPSLQDSDFVKENKVAFIARCMEHITSADEVSTDDPCASALVDRCLDCLRYFLQSCSTTVPTDDDGTTTKVEKPNDVRIKEREKSKTIDLNELEEKLQHLEIFPSPVKELSNADGPTYSGLRRPSWSFRQSRALLEAIQDGCEEEEDLVSSDNLNPLIEKDLVISNGLSTLEISTQDRRFSLDRVECDSILRPTQLTKSPTVRTRASLEWVSTSQQLPGPDSAVEDVCDALRGLRTQLTERETIAQWFVNHKEYLSVLFSLTERSRDTAERAWQLLCQLPTDPDLLKKIVTLRPIQPADSPDNSEPQPVAWNELIVSTNSYRLQYALRLTEALLLPIENASRHASDGSRRQWRERFVRLGGLPHLSKILATVAQTPIDSKSMSPIQLTSTSAILRIVSYYTNLHTAGLINTKESLSPFDLRLIKESLPQAFSSVYEIEELTKSAIRLAGICAQCLCDSEQEVFAAAVEVFCALARLNPAVVRTVVQHIDGGIKNWLKQLFIDPQNEESRKQVLHQFTSLLSDKIKHDEEPALQSLILHASLQIVLSAEGCDQHAATELFDLVIGLVATATKTAIESLKAKDISDHAVENAFRLWRVDRTSKHAETRFHNLLRLLLALANRDTDLKTAILNYRNGDSVDTMPGTECILDVLIDGVLWSTEDHPSYLSAGSTLEHSIREVAHGLVDLLCFSAPFKIETQTHVVQALRKYHVAVQRKLNELGRPWGFTPSDELQDEDIAFTGLTNPGCVCYMNSLLQQLFMIPNFRNGLCDLDCSILTSTNSEEETAQEEVIQLQKLIVRLIGTRYKSVDPTAFALAHKDLDGNPTDVTIQMDADEFFCLLLDRVETYLRRSHPGDPPNAKSTFLDHCFGGVLSHQIVTENGHVSEREEKFFALSLDIAKKQHLTESLASYVHGETLDGDNAYYCEKVQRKVRATKRVCIKKLPQTLVCHLKRFEFDFDTMEKVKINDYLEFPDTLDMRPYMTSVLEPSAMRADDRVEDSMYSLVGVVVHSGTSDAGHYYSFIRDRRDNPASKHWFEFNDQTVRPFDINTLEDECFGGESVSQRWDPVTRSVSPCVQVKKRNAYMLLYERMTPDEQSCSLDPRVVNIACLPDSVRSEFGEISRDVSAFSRVVNAFDVSHDQMLALVLDGLNELARSELSVSWDMLDHRSSMQVTPLCGDLVIGAVAVACEQVFGISTLRKLPEGSRDCAAVDSITKLVNSLSSLVSQCNEVGALLSCLVLRTVVGDLEMPLFRRRTQLFDALFLASADSVDSSLLLSCLQHCVQTLVAWSSRVGSEDQRVLKFCIPSLTEFFSSAVSIFYDREDLDIVDVHSSNVVPIAQNTVIHGVTLLGEFFVSCLSCCTGEALDLFDLFANSARFIETFYDSLLTDRSSALVADRLSSMSTPVTTNAGLLTSRLRSCTFSLERKLLEMLASRFNPKAITNQRLLHSQQILKSTLVYEFDEALTPYFVRYLDETSQTEKFLASSIAVLEELKTVNLDQLFGIFRALLQAGEENDYRESNLPSLLFSPTSGILEAAAYYRNHRTLHEYSFLLVEFAILEAAKFDSVRRYFQKDDAIRGHVAWVKEWLLEYLDPHGAIRELGPLDERSRDEIKSQDDRDSSEEDVLLREVRKLFEAAERGFGFSIFSMCAPSIAATDVAVDLADIGDDSIVNNQGEVCSNFLSVQDHDDISSARAVEPSTRANHAKMDETPEVEEHEAGWAEPMHPIASVSHTSSAA